MAAAAGRDSKRCVIAAASRSLRRSCSHDRRAFASAPAAPRERRKRWRRFMRLRVNSSDYIDVAIR